MIIKLKDVNWVHILIQIFALTLTIAAVIWGLAETRGDTRWAAREHVEAISDDLLVNGTLDKEHRQRGDIHEGLKIDVMRLDEKTTDALDSLRSEQAEFWSEQRAVNREILQRLPQ